jgi:hypothetical protein
LFHLWPVYIVLINAICKRRHSCVGTTKITIETLYFHSFSLFTLLHFLLLSHFFFWPILIIFSRALILLYPSHYTSILTCAYTSVPFSYSHVGSYFCILLIIFSRALILLCPSHILTCTHTSVPFSLYFNLLLYLPHFIVTFLSTLTLPFPYIYIFTCPYTSQVLSLHFHLHSSFSTVLVACSHTLVLLTSYHHIFTGRHAPSFS